MANEGAIAEVRHGAFTGMLVGSVIMHCVSNAACPVVVIRGRV
ncbi:MAG TPA: universal stress protein [Streptosporangiaceae bacterium]|nr:universal stress protein [Streptosporangiaceae bacterium]